MDHINQWTAVYRMFEVTSKNVLHALKDKKNVT